MYPVFNNDGERHLTQGEKGSRSNKSRKLHALGRAVAFAACAAVSMGVLAPEGVQAAEFGPVVTDGQHQSGTCKHKHYLDSALASLRGLNRCVFKSKEQNGQPCEVENNGKTEQGICMTQSLGTPTINCVCVPPRHEAITSSITNLHETVGVLVKTQQGAAQLGTEATRAQYVTLIPVLVANQQELMAFRPANVGDVILLRKIDEILTFLPLISSFASSLGITFPLSDVRAAFLLIKGDQLEGLGLDPA
jgi:hypothetical protein